MAHDRTSADSHPYPSAHSLHERLTRLERVVTGMARHVDYTHVDESSAAP